jgi:argininosuccinate lyase
LQRAHSVALVEAGILSEREGAEVCGALDEIAKRSEVGTCPESDVEDIHTWIESELTEATGAAGRKIHTARSRNDQVATLLKLYVIDVGERLSSRLDALTRSFCERAISWSALVFPLQTHCQFAAPGSVGFWSLRYASAFERAGRRLELSLCEWRRFCPLGSGAVAGSSIPIDRRTQARELGFDGPSLNALDSTSTRDECLEMLAIETQVALQLQSLATDVIAFSQTPFGWTVYPSAFGTGSSMMPNKTNPDAMELLRGESRAIPAAHAHAVSLLGGLPSGYNRDLQCIKPIVRDASETLIELCDLAEAFVGALDFDAEKLADALNRGAIDATLRMEQHVLRGRPLREAHAHIAETLGRSDAGDACDPVGAESYRTIGCASAAETCRVAREMLSKING